MSKVSVWRLRPRTPIEKALRPFQRFVQTESSGGVVLLLAALAALAWANSPWGESYLHLWEAYLGLALGPWQFRMSLHHFINDALMVVFFFLVGLEIKREILVGELSSMRAAGLPIAAAVGGMVVPALIYAALNAGGEGASGWGIPMATDIAFALGVLALMGPRAPLGLKIFLTALAIVDDLGAVLVIALFYTADVDVGALAAAAVVLAAMALMNRLGFRKPLSYLAAGVLLWFAVHASGVHATIAGVLAAMAIPSRTRIHSREFLATGRRILDEFDAAGVEGESVLSNHGQQAAIQALETRCEAAQAPLQRIEHDLQLWVAFLIIPLFALANAGVRLGGDASLLHPVTLGVILGLVVGKPVGITLFAWLATRAGLAELPDSVTWRAVAAAGCLGGIGFTMSLFVGTLAFGEGAALLDSAKLGILVASALSALLGWLLLFGPSGTAEETRDLDPARSGALEGEAAPRA